MRNDRAAARTEATDALSSPPAPESPCLPSSLAWPSPEFEALFKVVYDELRQLAATYLSRESPDHTLQPTALVHEAYLRLIEQQALRSPQCREHFLGLACTMMRRILVDHVRGKHALKRGGDGLRLSLTSDELVWRHRDVDLLALDEALEDLNRLSGRQRQIVEMRFFGGMTELEVAAALGIAERTVRADWAMAKAWLSIRLDGADAA